MKKEYTFTFSFTGENAQMMAERFAAYFWDGGLDQYLEQDFFQQYGLSCDDFKFLENDHVEIDTNEAAE